jgi:hypothetical protein
LDALDTNFVKERGEIVIGKLNFLAIGWGSPTMRGMLRTRRHGVLKSVHSFGDVTGHGDVDPSVSVIPIDGETEIAGARPVFGEVIFGGKGIKEVIGVLLGKEFDSEVIDSESESGATRGVAPETWSVCDRDITEMG